MNDGIGLAEALLGLDGFTVLEVAEGPAELVITIESVAELVGCGRCGVRAEAQARAGCRSTSAISPASAAPPGWCGGCGNGTM